MGHKLFGRGIGGRSCEEDAFHDLHDAQRGDIYIYICDVVSSGSIDSRKDLARAFPETRPTLHSS